MPQAGACSAKSRTVSSNGEPSFARGRRRILDPTTGSPPFRRSPGRSLGLAAVGADDPGLVESFGELLLHLGVLLLQVPLLALERLEADFEGFLLLGEELLDLGLPLRLDKQAPDRPVDRSVVAEGLQLVEGMDRLAELHVELHPLLGDGLQVLLDALELLQVVLKLRRKGHGEASERPEA